MPYPHALAGLGSRSSTLSPNALFAASTSDVPVRNRSCRALVQPINLGLFHNVGFAVGFPIAHQEDSFYGKQAAPGILVSARLFAPRRRDMAHRSTKKP